MTSFTITARGLDETRRAGVALGKLAYPGLVIALSGTLGAGKTFFTRAVAEGLDIVDPRLVTSPTFILIQEYAARLPIYHFDVYRLADPAAFFELGVDEYFESDGICLVEWSDRVADYLPPHRLNIDISILADADRSLSAEAIGESAEKLLGAWESELMPTH